MKNFININALYNDLLTKFANSNYEPASRNGIVKTIKATFKKLTGVGINERITDYNYQQVIDTLSNAKIPHCTFAAWLREYGTDEPQATNYDESTVVELEEELEILDTNLEIQEAYIATLESKIVALEAKVKSLEPQPEPVTLIDMFVTAYGKDHESYRYLNAFITDYKVKHGYSHPWLEVTPEMYELLQKWISVKLPELTKINKLC